MFARRVPLVAGCCLVSCAVATADPCGMVPPITPGGQIPIARVGYQQTYVFYKEGVETFAIRPGFRGNVDNFGMLIPFPSVPELRKVSDNIFRHLAAAVDPPEIVVDLRERYLSRLKQSAQSAPNNGRNRGNGLELADDEVRVVRQEAVGMYEVAVIEAGSANALKKWMEEHKFVYPKGMDKPVNDYVKQKWCFVAVKTRVGSKTGSDPKPGLRKLDNKMPAGSTFDGHVQAMAFRFRTPKLVVPMRLGAFNQGDLHNVVYVLSDSPVKIDGIPEEYVVRQLPGSEVYRNVTGPLPLRVIGGTVNQLRGYYKTDAFKQRRDPRPHNGAARDLFAGDLLAVQQNRLSHPHEEAEKMLLSIGEELGLRGGEIDALNEKALGKEREDTADKALADMKSNMTLTVIDGNFPRKLIADKNLAFSSYKMPARRNASRFYDATRKGPGGEKTGAVIFRTIGSTDANSKPVAKTDRGLMLGLAMMTGLVVFGLVLIRRRRK